MRKKPRRSVRRINWYAIDEVKAYALRLGAGMTVYKHPDRPNYNITHTSRTDLYRPEWVVYQTGGL